MNSSLFDSDEEGWEDMPVITSSKDSIHESSEDEPSSSNPKSHRKRNSRSYRWSHYSSKPVSSSHYQESTPSTNTAFATVAATNQSNATGAILEIDEEGTEWREKRINEQQEEDYTRLELDEDKETEEVWERTGYLFDDVSSSSVLGLVIPKILYRIFIVSLSHICMSLSISFSST
jgi:hypothetical protein